MVASMAAVHSRGSVFIPMSRVNRVYRTFCIGTATAVLHAVADRFLVNIQTDVVHSLHGGASLVVSESARSLSSAFLHQALLHDLFIQTVDLVLGYKKSNESPILKLLLSRLDELVARVSKKAH